LVVAAIVEVIVVLTWISALVVLARISLLITTLMMLIRITTLWLGLSTSAVRSLIHLRWRGTKTTHLVLILHGMHQKSE